MGRLLPAFVLLAAVACSPAGGGADNGDSSGLPDEPDPAYEHVYEAAVIPKSLLQEVVDLGHDLRPDRLSTFPFSMLLLHARFDDSDDLRRLAREGAPPPSPRDFWVDAGEGRLTLLPPGSVYWILSRIKDGKARGEFRFRCKGFVEGRATFNADQLPDKDWRIVSISLPATGESVQRRDDGTWMLVENE